jgi:SAM-dependent methyltransferase
VFEALATLQRAPECADLLQFRSLVTAHQYSKLAELVAEYLPPGCAVLDWGCGNGHFSFALSRWGYEVAGYSFEDFGLRSHLPAAYDFTLADPTDPTSLPFPDSSFKAVVSVGVLEHVRETGGQEAASLREIARIMEPGGRFICYHFPNRDSWIEALNALLPGAHHHTYRYNRNDIIRLCEGAGLNCLAMGRYGMLPRNVWHRAPGPLRHSRSAAHLWDGLDEALGRLFDFLAQNYYFVAERPLGKGAA